MKTRKLGFSKQLFIQLTVVLILTTILMAVVLSNKVDKMLLKKTQATVSSTATYAANMIDANHMRDIVASGEESEYWDEIYDQVSFFRDNGDIEYIYIVARIDGELVYVLDTDLEDPADYGDVCEGDSDAEIALAGTPITNSECTRDEWGSHLSSWVPIKDDSQVVAILGVDVSYDDVLTDISKVKTTVLICFSFTFVLVWMSILAISLRLSKGFKQIDAKIGDLTDGSGDLTKKIEDNSGTEFEIIANHINEFLEEIRQLVLTVSSTSEAVSESMNQVASSSETCANDAESISAVTEELSASMQMVSDNIQSLNASTEEMLGSISETVNTVRETNELVDDIKERAFETKTSTSGKESAISSTLVVAENKLRACIEQSKRVSDISSLTGDILKISGQTNLLALNASIEAARAGEAGRGFAVVADEIRQLAEGSKNNANSIQEISSYVVNAVEELMQSADEILNLLNETILPEYKEFIKIADKYSEDADNMKALIASVSQNIDDIYSNVEKLAENTDNIANAVEDCDKGIAESALSTQNLAAQFEEVTAETNTVNTSVSYMRDNITKYKA